MELLMLYRWAIHGNIRVVCDVTKCHWASDFGHFEGSMLPTFLGSCSPSFFSSKDTLSYPIRLKFSVTPLWEAQIWQNMWGLSVWQVHLTSAHARQIGLPRVCSSLTAVLDCCKRQTVSRSFWDMISSSSPSPVWFEGLSRFWLQRAW